MDHRGDADCILDLLGSTAVLAHRVLVSAYRARASGNYRSSEILQLEIDVVDARFAHDLHP